jgi:hypothetical protein
MKSVRKSVTKNWMIISQGKLPSHSSGDPGVETAVSFDPKQKTGAVIFINSPTLTFKTQRVYYKMINKLFRIGKKF